MINTNKITKIEKSEEWYTNGAAKRQIAVKDSLMNWTNDKC